MGSRKPPFFSTGAWAGFAKTRKGKVVYKRKKHFFTFKTLPRILLSITTFDRDRDFPPLRALLILSARRAYEFMDIGDYNDLIKSLIVEDENIRERWKEMTMWILRQVIASIPKPEPLDEFSSFVDELLMAFANQFYDWLFQFSF